MFKTQWIGYKTILKREITRLFRIWTQTFIPPIITMTLYFLIFGKFIGSKLDSIHSFSYIEFIIPGLIMMSIVTNSYTNVASTFFGAKFQKHIEEILVAPIPNIIILIGFVAGGVARGICVGIVVTFVALFFTKLSMHSLGITIAIVLLTSIAFSLGGLINAIFAEKFDDIAIIPNFVLAPLIYLGGVFYSIDMLPEFWQKVSGLNPILYMVNAFRYGILGESDINITHAFTILIIFILILFYISLYLLNKGTRIKN